MDKIVYIKRRPYDRANVSRANELVYADKHNVGPSMTSSGGVYKGIDFNEERILMPLLVGLPCDHPEFMLRSNDYFNNIRKRVPVEGVKLNVSLKDDSKPLSVDNFPGHPEEYVLYRYCKGYRDCGEDLEACKANAIKRFFLYSEADTIQTENNKAKQITESVRAYSKISEDSQLMDAVLRVLAGTTKSESIKLGVPNPETLDDLSKQNLLSNISVGYPEKFISVTSNKLLAKLAEVYELVDNGVIEMAGNKFIFEGEELGNSPEHVVSFISAAANSKKFTIMKAKLSTIKESVPA